MTICGWLVELKERIGLRREAAKESIPVYHMNSFRLTFLCAYLICQRLQWIRWVMLWQRQQRQQHKWFKNYIKHRNEWHNFFSSFSKKNEPDDLMSSNTLLHMFIVQNLLNFSYQRMCYDDVGDDDCLFWAAHDSVFIITQINKPNECHILSLICTVLNHIKTTLWHQIHFTRNLMEFFLYTWPLCGLIFKNGSESCEIY